MQTKNFKILFVNVDKFKLIVKISFWADFLNTVHNYLQFIKMITRAWKYFRISECGQKWKTFVIAVIFRLGYQKASICGSSASLYLPNEDEVICRAPYHRVSPLLHCWTFMQKAYPHSRLIGVSYVWSCTILNNNHYFNYNCGPVILPASKWPQNAEVMGSSVTINALTYCWQVAIVVIRDCQEQQNLHTYVPSYSTI